MERKPKCKACGDNGTIIRQSDEGSTWEKCPECQSPRCPICNERVDQMGLSLTYRGDQRMGQDWGTFCLYCVMGPEFGEKIRYSGALGMDEWMTLEMRKQKESA